MINFKMINKGINYEKKYAQDKGKSTTPETDWGGGMTCLQEMQAICKTLDDAEPGEVDENGCDCSSCKFDGG